MAENCVTGSGFPGGQNLTCLYEPGSLKGFILMKKGETFASETAFKAESVHATNIEDSYDVEAVFPNIYDYEVEKGAVQESTSPLNGYKTIDRIDPDTLMIKLETNNCDWNEMVSQLNGDELEFIAILSDGFCELRGDSNGVRRGFTAKVYAIPGGIPGKEKGESYTLKVSFKDIEEFKKRVFIKPMWTLKALSNYTPFGLSGELITDYDSSTGECVVQVKKRCGDAWVVSTDGELIMEFVETNNLTSPVLTSQTDGGNGLITFEIQKNGTPEDLDVDDWVLVRVGFKTSDVYNYISNEIYIPVKS